MSGADGAVSSAGSGGARARLKGDAARIVEAAVLPGPVAGIVRRTVSATRLWPAERAEVARELVAHFADGLERGASVEELVGSWGEPGAAALLIRRSVKRKRPAAWRVLAGTLRWTAIGVVGVFALCLLTYGILALRFYTGTPNIKRNFMEEINTPIRALPEDQKAWPVYLQAIDALRITREVTGTRFVGGESWAEVAAFLDTRQEGLALARKAAARPALGYEISDRADPRLLEAHERAGLADYEDPEPGEVNPPLYSVLLPYLGELRRLSWLLVADARLAAQQGDGSRAAADIEAMLGMAGHCRDLPTLIGDLVAIAIGHRATLSMLQVLLESPDLWDEATLQRLAHRFAALPSHGGAWVRLDTERDYVEDTLQRIYTDDGEGDGRLAAGGLRRLEEMTDGGGSGFAEIDLLMTVGEPVLASLLAGRREMREKFEEMWNAAEAMAREPMWERGPDAFDAKIEALMSSPVRAQRYMLVTLLMPAVGKAVQNGDLAEMDRDAAVACIALELHKRDRGGYPASLDELVPGLLPRVPLDHFTGEPLRYVREGDGFRLYGVGADLDDDGGRWPVRVRRYTSVDDREVEVEEIDERGARRFLGADRIAAYRASGRPDLVPDGDIVYWPPRVEWDEPAPPEAKTTIYDQNLAAP